MTSFCVCSVAPCVLPLRYAGHDTKTAKSSGHNDGYKHCQPSTSCPWPPRTVALVRNRFSTPSPPIVSFRSQRKTTLQLSRVHCCTMVSTPLEIDCVQHWVFLIYECQPIFTIWLSCDEMSCPVVLVTLFGRNHEPGDELESGWNSGYFCVCSVASCVLALTPPPLRRAWSCPRTTWRPYQGPKGTRTSSHWRSRSSTWSGRYRPTNKPSASRSSSAMASRTSGLRTWVSAALLDRGGRDGGVISPWREEREGERNKGVSALALGGGGGGMVTWGEVRGRDGGVLSSCREGRGDEQSNRPFRVYCHHSVKPRSSQNHETSGLLPFFLSSFLPFFLSSFLPFFLSSFLPFFFSSFLPFFLSSFLSLFHSFFLVRSFVLSLFLSFLLSSFFLCFRSFPFRLFSFIHSFFVPTILPLLVSSLCFFVRSVVSAFLSSFPSKILFFFLHTCLQPNDKNNARWSNEELLLAVQCEYTSLTLLHVGLYVCHVRVPLGLFARAHLLRPPLHVCWHWPETNRKLWSPRLVLCCPYVWLFLAI